MLFESLKNEAVRFTVQTHGLNNGTVTYEKYQGLGLSDIDAFDFVQFVDQYGNNMAKANQVLQEINKIEVFHYEWITVLEIKHIEWNEGLCGFVITIQDDRIVQVQFDKITDGMDGRFGQYRAHVDTVNDYVYDLTDLERELFDDWLRVSDIILNEEDELEMLDAAE